MLKTIHIFNECRVYRPKVVTTHQIQSYISKVVLEQLR